MVPVFHNYGGTLRLPRIFTQLFITRAHDKIMLNIYTMPPKSGISLLMFRFISMFYSSSRGCATKPTPNAGLPWTSPLTLLLTPSSLSLSGNRCSERNGPRGDQGAAFEHVSLQGKTASRRAICLRRHGVRQAAVEPLLGHGAGEHCFKN